MMSCWWPFALAFGFASKKVMSSLLSIDLTCDEASHIKKDKYQDGGVLEALEKLRSSLRCMSCTELLADPSILPCGHRICRACISVDHRLCQLCDKAYSAADPKKSVLLNHLLASFKTVDSLLSSLLPEQDNQVDTTVLPGYDNDEAKEGDQNKTLAEKSHRESMEITQTPREVPPTQLSLPPSAPLPSLSDSLPLSQSSQTLHRPSSLAEQNTLEIENEILRAKERIESALKRKRLSFSHSHPTPSSSLPLLSQDTTLGDDVRPSNSTQKKIKKRELSRIGAPPLVPSSSSRGRLEELDLDGMFSPPSISYSPLLLQSTENMNVNSVASPNLSPILMPNSSPFATCKILATYFTENQRELVEHCASKGWIQCSGEDWEVSDSPKILVTSVVDRESRRTQRSLLYMKCLLLGFLIVDFSWLEDSEKQNEFLPPYDYEVEGTLQDIVPKAPLRSRCIVRGEQGGIALLRGYVFFIEEDSVYTCFSREDVEWLIIKCCGVVKSRTAYSFEKTSTGSSSGLQKNVNLSLRLRSTRPKEKCKSPDGQVEVACVNWLFDTICNLRPPLDMSSYLL